MKKYLPWLLFLLLLLTACKKIAVEPSQTESLAETPSSTASEVLILVIDEWPPYTTQEMEQKGIATEIIIEALKAADLEYKIEFRPWARALEMVQYGQAWGSFPWFYTEERAEIYAYSDPVITVDSVIFYRKDNPKFQNGFPEYSTLQDLKAYTFGGVNGYFYEIIFENESFSYTLSQSLESAFKLLIEGKTDVINEDLNVGMHILQKYYPDSSDTILASHDYLSKDDMFLLISKSISNHEETLEKFNKGLELIKSNGLYNDIISKHQAPSGKE